MKIDIETYNQQRKELIGLKCAVRSILDYVLRCHGNFEWECCKEKLCNNKIDPDTLNYLKKKQK